MSGILRWLQKNKFRAHGLAFILMILPATLLYFAARQSWEILMWALIAAVIIGNLIALSVK